MAESSYAVSVDIGGTFTDFVLLDLNSGESRVTKMLTTPNSPVECVKAGLDGLLQSSMVDPADLESFIHATTLATNVVTEGKGSRVAMLTTEGFRDVIETGREGRYDGYDLQIVIPPPLVERRNRIPVLERIDYRGEVIIPLTTGEVDRLVGRVVDGNFDSVAVCLLHSYVNPEHELLLGKALQRRVPGIPISLSHEVLPKQGEFERFQATVINSYVRPRIEKYLKELEDYCFAIGVGGAIYLMMSNGGMSALETASRYPVRMIESGPAAGVIGACKVAEDLAMRRVLSFDMGGTTAKACLIDDFQPQISSQLEVARLKRFASGSGYPVALPSIDLLEVGAGGGSIARVNEMGLLEVGPDSAGADPGPACYDRGGQYPTVTDADLALGILNSRYFLGGKMEVSHDAASLAIEEHLAKILNQDVLSCAWGVFDVVNENMARALRIHAVENGIDPRSCDVIAFGGAGPVHACAVAEKLGISHIVSPDGAGVGSAYGLVFAPRISDESISRVTALSKVSDSFSDDCFEMLLGRIGVLPKESTIRFLLDLRLVDQFFEITVLVGEGTSVPKIDVETLGESFSQEYARRFGRVPEHPEIEVVNWRVQANLPTPARARRATESRSRLDGYAAVHDEREVFLGPRGHVRAAVVSRYDMTDDLVVQGPAIVEERESTTLVMPGYETWIDAGRNLHIGRKGLSWPAERGGDINGWR